MPRRLRRPSPRHARSLALALLPLLATDTRALSIAGYSPEAHNRFASGFLTQPVANTSPSFVGAGFDLSGVGWFPGTGIPGTGRSRNFALITPLHIMQARHYPTGKDSVINFLAADGTLQRNTLLGHSTVNTGTYGNDLSVGTFATTFSADQGVANYRVLDVRSSSISRDLGGLPFLIYGSQADSVGPRLAFATGTAAPFSLANVQHWSGSGSGTAQQWEGGDSGGPGFVRYTAPDGSTTLTYAGPALHPSGFTTLLPQDRFNWSPPDGINALIKLDGYALKWTLYDNPADTVRTAPQWTGAASSLLSSAANWSLPGAPAGLSVLFDAAAANGVTTLTLDGDLTLRGALFKASASSAGFTFAGTGTLKVGYTGLRNESAATQTFDVPIALAGAQNWEAAEGDLIFNGIVDTTADAHLLMVGGARDTTLNGLLTGAGALAKDDTGVLTLNAHNTYAGNTWIHNGALRLGTGSLPSNTTVIFDTTNPAALDLNGHNQTLAGLRSTYGGAGEVRLGGATLTLDLSNTQEFAGNLTGTGALNKTGTGAISLSGANTYIGATSVTAGVVRLASENALSPDTNIKLAGGVLELGAADHNATLGTGAGQIQFTANGGFSAHGATRTVTLNNGAALTWGQAHFVKSSGGLIFSSSVSDATVEFANPLVLGATGTNTRSIFVNNGSAAVDARLAGNISDGTGTYTLAKFNPGTLELTGTNTYKGGTFIGGGALRIGSAGALPAGSGVVLAGGVLELGVADYHAGLGAGAGQVRFAGDGGFSAAGADRIVNLGGAATPATLTWGENNFLSTIHSLVLSSAGSDATVDFRNSLVLGTTGSGMRTVRVDNGSAAVDARLSGNISQAGGSFGLTKTGAGTLELTGANTYSGATTVSGGVLRIATAGALSASSNLVLAGGSVELASGNYDAALGAAAGQIRFAGSGGFAASGGDRTVNLGGSIVPGTLTWGSGDFIPHGESLLLSSTSADGTLIFRNPLLLGTTGGASRTINVEDGAAAIDARLTGALSHGAGTFGITKTGAGTLELTGTNTYGGYTNINGGVLRIGAAGALSPNTRISLRNGAILELAHGDFSATIGGSEPGLVTFEGPAGFSAAGATRTVTLNNGAALRWGVPTGIPITTDLIFSSQSADATLVFTNALELINAGPEHRTVRVNNGSAAIDARLSGAISQIDGTYGLQKLGAGTLELTAANSYKGTTFVREGTLLVNGNQSNATGAVVVFDGATLGGGGHIGGATHVSRGGTLAPGNGSDRSLAFSSRLEFEAGSRFLATLATGDATSVAGADYTQVTVASEVSLGGAFLALELIDDFGSTAQTGMVFTLLSTNGLLGTFAQGHTTHTTVDGKLYDFGIAYTNSGVTLELLGISAVPEPALAATLLGCAAWGAACLRRRRRA